MAFYKHFIPNGISEVAILAGPGTPRARTCTHVYAGEAS